MSSHSSHISAFIAVMFWMATGTVLAQHPHIQRIKFNIAAAEPMCSKILQDRKGYLWLGSDQGLYRYDGHSFDAFLPPEDSLECKVSGMCEAPDGILWIGCKNGSIYTLRNDRLELFHPEEGTAGTGISDILADSAGVIWWSTYGEGIYYYANGRVFNINHEDGLTEDYVYDLEADGNGLIWAGTDGGITVLKQEQGRKIVNVPEWNDRLPDPIVRVVKYAPEGRLYLGFYDAGTGYVNLLQNQFIHPEYNAHWSYGPVSDLQVHQPGIWISTLNGNLLYADHQQVHNFATFPGFQVEDSYYGRISDLEPDSEGNIWVAAASGIYRTTGNKLWFYNIFGDTKLENIHAILFDDDGADKLWFSNEQGLYRMDFNRNELRNYLGINLFKELKVTCLAKDPYGYIWAGTFNYGAFRIDPTSGRYNRITESEGLINNNVLGISIHKDTLWMATLGGATELVIRPDLEHGIADVRSFNSDNGLVSNYIYDVYEDERNRIWFATDGDGISMLEAGRFRNFGKDKGLADDVIYSIEGDHYGNIWIATASDGIYYFDGNNFHHVGLQEGLNNQNIAGLAISGEEVLAIQDNGLDIIHIPTGRLVHFGEEVNLGEMAPDLNVVSKDPSGNIWIGTKKGIVRFKPGISGQSPGPSTVLEQMAVFLEPVNMSEGLSLRSFENNVSFNYTGIWLSNPEQVRFQVRLEGYDLDWKDTYDRTAVYSSLPPGDYTFRVRSSVTSSFSNSPDTSFAFKINRPFWATPLFVLLVACLAVLMVYLYIRYREKRLKKLEQQKKEKIEFEFQMLKNQVNPHFLFNSFSTLIALIEENREQAVEYTEKLSDFFRIILQLKEEELIPVSHELKIIEDYYFLLKKRFGNNLTLEINLPEEVQRSLIPPMTLQILLENAVKHNIISKDKPLIINIYAGESGIIAENNLQIKKSTEASTGIGLENIFKRYRLKTSREPIIEKTQSVFRVILPFIQSSPE